MKTRIVIAIIEAVVSYFCIAWGFVWQKKGIDWLGHRGRKDYRYYKNLRLWSCGLALLILAGIPNYLALEVLGVQTINAISSLNIVFIVFLSKLLLKESLFRSDYLYTIILCASAVMLIGLVDWSTAVTIRAGYTYVAALVPVGLFLVWLGLRVTKILKAHSLFQAVALAALGGAMSGLLAIYMKVLQTELGTKFLYYLGSPFFYYFLVLSLLSQVAFQLAYKMGAMIMVGPTQYATTVFYSVLAAYPIFQIPVHPAQVICFSVIVIAMMLMVYQHGKEAGKGCIAD